MRQSTSSLFVTIIGACLSVAVGCGNEARSENDPAGGENSTNVDETTGPNSGGQAADGGGVVSGDGEGEGDGEAADQGNEGPPNYDGDWHGYTDEDFVQSVSFKVLDGQLLQFISSRDYESPDRSGGCQLSLSSSTPADIAGGQAVVSAAADIQLNFQSYASVTGTIPEINRSASCRPKAATFSAHRYRVEKPSGALDIKGTRWIGTIWVRIFCGGMNRRDFVRLGNLARAGWFVS